MASGVSGEGVPVTPRGRRGRRRVLDRVGEEGVVVDGLTYRHCNLVEFDGRSRIFSHRAILTVVVVSTCNAACGFCSNEVTFTPHGPFLRWDHRLRRVKEFALLCGVTKVAFTGGEPTLNGARLLDLARAVIPGFKRARLHTNGYGLLRSVASETADAPLLQALVGAGLTGVSVSVAHAEPETNRAIMRFSAKWKGMSDDDLAETASYRTDNFAPRLSCVMCRQGVHTVSEILDYVRWGRSLGFRNFIFRSCSQIPGEFQKPTEFSRFNEDNYIPIDPLVDELDRMGFEKRFHQRKSDSKVDTYGWNDVVFDVDESSEEADPDAKIRRLNVMPNGIAYTCWIDPLAVLFEEDLPAAMTARDREFSC